MQIDKRISLGNFLVAFGMLVAGATAWGAWTTTTKTVVDQLSKHSSQIEAHEARLRIIETTTARQDERMILILDSLRKIESRLER